MAIHQLAQKELINIDDFDRSYSLLRLKILVPGIVIYLEASCPPSTLLFSSTDAEQHVPRVQV